MNLSDLVHRTAGDNKVLTSNLQTSTNTMITPSTLQPPPPSSFEHITPELTTVDSSSFQRQQQEAYLFPMQAAANWTPQAFLQHQQQHKDAASRIPIEQKKTLLDCNSPYQQNSFTFTTTPASNTIAKPTTTQKIAPAPPSFNNNNNNTLTSNTAAASNNININNSNSNNNNNNIIATSQEVKVFHQQSIAPYPRNVFQVYGQQQQQQQQQQSNPHYNVTTSASSSTTSSTATTATTTTITTTANGLVPIAPLQTAEEPKKPAIMITGDNVDANNLEEGYIQFVLRHDANYIGDGIESLMYAKRKFSSVPKTGDLSYTTWDIFQLVQKLYTQEIRNWSQLVGQLGLADMAGRPQFAQRVKRWMHKYKIDCYFDYLLGNEYNFNSPDEKYSGCLMMGNYQKRKSENGKRTDETDSVRSSEDEHRRGPNRKRFSDDDMENEDAEDSDDVNTGRIPILLAGSRKRMRDTSQSSLQMIESARQFMKTTANQSEDDEDQENEEGLEEEEDDNDGMMIDRSHHDNSETDGEDEEEEEIPTNHNTDNMARDSPMVDHAEIDEEDELASTCSSPGSALLDISSNIPLDDTPFSPSPLSPRSNTEEPFHYNNASSCSNCNSDNMESMKSEVAQLKSFIKTLESKLEQQIKLNENNTKQIEKLMDEKQQLRSSTEKWKRKLIEDLVRGPKLISDDDDDNVMA
ncbi:hypothetical protein K501DRAFT_335815 [Backusella circina FSU 941]|nr:hypothetical protein K501DRAFT_335815 [Backusella circina FSU 941]